MKIAGFDWSKGNDEKIKKYGISSCDIEDFFESADPFIYPDPYIAKMNRDFLHSRSLKAEQFLLYSLLDQ